MMDDTRQSAVYIAITLYVPQKRILAATNQFILCRRLALVLERHESLLNRHLNAQHPESARPWMGTTIFQSRHNRQSTAAITWAQTIRSRLWVDYSGPGPRRRQDCDLLLGRFGSARRTSLKSCHAAPGRDRGVIDFLIPGYTMADPAMT